MLKQNKVENESYEAIGIVELKYFTFALEVADQMSKTANVHILGSENYLGGRLVSVVIGGRIADVQAAVELAKDVCAKKPSNPLKMAVFISNPHPEIMKFILPSQSEGNEIDLKDVVKEQALEKNHPDGEEKIELERPKRQIQGRKRNRKVKEEEQS